MIEVKDLNDVEVDGERAGTITDVLSNYKGRVKETYDALQAWSAAADADAANRHAAALADLQAKLDAVNADAKATAERHAAEVAQLQTYVDACAGTEEAKRLAAEKVATERAAKIAATEAELVRLKKEHEADVAVADPAAEVAEVRP